MTPDQSRRMVEALERLALVAEANLLCRSREYRVTGARALDLIANRVAEVCNQAYEEAKGKT